MVKETKTLFKGFWILKALAYNPNKYINVYVHKPNSNNFKIGGYLGLKLCVRVDEQILIFVIKYFPEPF